MAVLLVALVALFAVAPFIEHHGARYWDAILTSLLLIGALFAVAGHRRRNLIVVLIGLPVLVGRWVVLIWYGNEPSVFYIVGLIFFISVVVWQMLRFIIWAPSVTTEVLWAGLATYLLLALLWAAAYIVVARLDPNAFEGVAPVNQPLHGFNALYFSVGCLTTGGGGAIVPFSGAARMLAMFEGITGPLFLAVLISRLVSLHTSVTKDR